MRITKLELKGYKRLLLSGIQNFTYTPNSPLQIIIGTNGCGKSSLLFELSPLPASPSDYLKGGYKKIELEHNGLSYQLESVFSSSNSHSFIKDGVELNPGKTSQFQKDLALKEFGWSKEIHDLILGIDKFTLMSPTKRREWILQLSHVSYDYILGLYQRIANQQRDMQGAYKHLNTRYQSEVQKLNASDDDELSAIADGLRDELNILMRNTPYINNSLDNTIGLLDELNKVSSEILECGIPSDIGSSYKAILDDKIQLNQELSTLESILDRSGKEYSELESQSSLYKSDDFNVDVDHLIAENKNKVDRYVKGIFTIPNPSGAYEASINIQSDWHDLFSSLPDNTDRWYSRDNYKLFQDQLKRLKDQSNQISLKLSILNNKKKTIESIDDTNCPSCGHSWKIGYSETEIDNLTKQLEELTVQSDKIDRNIKDTNENIEKLEIAQSLYLRLSNLVQANPLLKPLWDHVLANRLHFNRPSESVGLFKTWLKECDAATQFEDAKKNLEHYTKIKESKESGLYYQYVEKKKKLQLEIEDTTLRISSLKNEIKLLDANIDIINRLMGNGELLNDLQIKLNECIENEYKRFASKQIEDQIKIHQNKLAHAQTALSQVSTLRGIVDDIAKNKEDVKRQLDAAMILTKTLSPQSGLIAEEINRFINCLVDQLNSVLASIWTYDLKILPCQIEDSGELNYRFALDHGLGNPVSDISKGSQAQQDIVNFSFVLLVLLFKGLENVPLFLDELGASFDEQHRINLMSFIKHLTDTNRFSQIFLISHYASQYATMAQAEVMVLDQKNVAVPQHYNNHVSFH